MPIYEYQCQSCEKVFEYMQRMSEDPKKVCEECQGALERIISQSAFHLKGGGWYKDLYSSTKKDDSSGKGDSSASSTPSSDSKKDSSESKPAADSKPAAAPKPASSGTKD